MKNKTLYKLSLLLSVVVILSAFLASPVHSQCQSIGSIRVITSALNIRVLPITGTTDGSLSKDDVRLVDKRDPVSGWYHLCNDGWVSGRDLYVVFTASTQAPVVTPTRITPMPTPIVTPVFIRIWVDGADMGIRELRGGELISIQIERIEFFGTP